MTEAQAACLLALAEITRPRGEHCSHFAPIERETRLSRQIVRRNVRALARKGFAEYYRGLWSEDGEPAGAGYCITDAGLAENERLRSEMA